RVTGTARGGGFRPPAVGVETAVDAVADAVRRRRPRTFHKAEFTCSCPNPRLPTFSRSDVTPKLAAVARIPYQTTFPLGKIGRAQSGTARPTDDSLKGQPEASIVRWVRPPSDATTNPHSRSYNGALHLDAMNHARSTDVWVDGGRDGSWVGGW
ncbi:hypothetical protein AB0F76_35100, partial [Streptomyces aureus]